MNISLTHHTIYYLLVLFVGRLVDRFLGRITTVGCQTALTRFHALLALCGRLMETRPSKTNSQIPDYVQNLLLERSALIFPFGNLWTFSPWHHFNLSSYKMLDPGCFGIFSLPLIFSISPSVQFCLCINHNRCMQPRLFTLHTCVNMSM